MEDREIGRIAADVEEGHPELAILVGEDRFGRRQRGQHQLVDLNTGALDALREVLHARLRRGHDVRLHLEPDRAHADRVPDALLAVDDVAAGNDVEDLAGVRDRDRARGLDRAEGVLPSDVAVVTRDGDHPA